MKNQLRVIAGDWRGRKIPVPDVPGLRPTPARVKETLFNWLRHDLIGACCLDLYAGSGALGLEAASRGARRVIQVDSDRRVCVALSDTVRRFGADAVQVVRADVDVFLQGPAQPFDLVFLDPPFRKGLVVECCRLLEERGWLTAAAKIYIESEPEAELALPAQWQRLRGKRAGDVAYSLYSRQLQGADS